MEEKRIWKKVQEKVFKFDTSRNVDEKKKSKSRPAFQPLCMENSLILFCKVRIKYRLF